MLLSRLAENLYWAGRYLERAEDTARLVRVQSELYLDLPGHLNVGWMPLLAVTGSTEFFRDRTDADGASLTEESTVVRFLTTSDANPGSVLCALDAARSNLRSVRALIPRSAWEVANSLNLWAVDNADMAGSRRSHMEWLEVIIRRCQTLAGMFSSIMSHDQAYRFLQIGRFLERADMTTRVLDVQATILLDNPEARDVAYSDIIWAAVLKSVTAVQMYRRVSRAGVSGTSALAFLLLDPQFPRTVYHCLEALSHDIHRLPRASHLAAGAVARAHTTLEGVIPTELDAPGMHELMDIIQTDLGAIHQAVVDTWFLAPSRPAAA